jgi:hypothetical protein
MLDVSLQKKLLRVKPNQQFSNQGEKKMSGKFEILAEFYQFMKERKKWWLGPIVIMLLLLGLLMVLTQGSAVAPFVYALF